VVRVATGVPRAIVVTGLRVPGIIAILPEPRIRHAVTATRVRAVFTARIRIFVGVRSTVITLFDAAGRPTRATVRIRAWDIVSAEVERTVVFATVSAPVGYTIVTVFVQGDFGIGGVGTASIRTTFRSPAIGIAAIEIVGDAFRVVRAIVAVFSESSLGDSVAAELDLAHRVATVAVDQVLVVTGLAGADVNVPVAAEGRRTVGIAKCGLHATFVAAFIIGSATIRYLITADRQ
jgi:hypothetical protein